MKTQIPKQTIKLQDPERFGSLSYVTKKTHTKASLDCGNFSTAFLWMNTEKKLFFVACLLQQKGCSYIEIESTCFK